MPEPALELVGAERFAATTKTAIRDLEDLTDAHRQAGEHLQTQARRRAPRRTGALVASFSARPTRDAVEFTVGAAHGKFQQFGTRHMSARPFMPDDVTDVTPYYVDAVDEAIKNIEGK